MEWAALSHHPMGLGTQQSSLSPVAVALLWGPDDLLRSDALATFLNCTAPSPGTNISVISPDVPRAEPWRHQDPAFSSVREPTFISIRPDVNRGTGLAPACHQLTDPWKARSPDSIFMGPRPPLSHLPVGRTVLGSTASEIRLNPSLPGKGNVLSELRDSWGQERG